MTSQRLLAAALALCTAGVPAVLLAQQTHGVIAGRAGNQFSDRYADYTVQLRNVATGQPVLAQPLDQYGRFSFPNLALNQRYLVELYRTPQYSLVCTEGPFRLVPETLPQKTDVTIECGKAPAILWLLLAGAGTASAVAVNTASPSR
jgi:hypothetical protein